MRALQEGDSREGGATRMAGGATPARSAPS